MRMKRTTKNKIAYHESAGTTDRQSKFENGGKNDKTETSFLSMMVEKDPRKTRI